MIDMLKEFDGGRDYYLAHSKEIQKQYPNKWIVLSSEGIIETGDSTISGYPNYYQTHVPYPPNCCQRCGLPDDNLINWVGDGGAFAASHGHSTQWCKLCCTGEQLMYARQQAECIDKLEIELMEIEQWSGRKFQAK